MILKHPDKHLYTSTSKFEFNDDTVELAKTISDSLMKEMNDNNLVGLSANQLGFAYSVIGIRGEDFYYIMFNPKIVHQEGEIVFDEACPSFPNVTAKKIKRSKMIRLRFQTPSGMVQTTKFVDLTAFTIQHLIEHLEGKNFLDNIPKYHKRKLMEKYYRK